MSEQELNIEDFEPRVFTPGELVYLCFEHRDTVSGSTSLKSPRRGTVVDFPPGIGMYLDGPYWMRIATNFVAHHILTSAGALWISASFVNKLDPDKGSDFRGDLRESIRQFHKNRPLPAQYTPTTTVRITPQLGLEPPHCTVYVRKHRVGVQDPITYPLKTPKIP